LLQEKPALAPIVITHRTTQPQTSLLLTSAYNAYQKGEFSLARNMYQQVLQVDPKNRGALLGLASIAMQGRETSVAREFYLRLLDQDPGDPLARAGMLALAPTGDLAQQESELKLLLKQYPQSAPLFFSLGNVYAAGQRWSEAQQAYFDALQQAKNTAATGSHASSVSGMSNNQSAVASVPPDYPFNLAISLEHLGQMKPAVTYYKEALQLSAGQPAGFDPEALRTRLTTLTSGATP
jgi:tetratricopeptide (TPR) repeat protein